MKGYTIENSIDLLEKDVKALKEGGGGGGGASTWNQLQGKPFNALGEELYNLDGDLTVNSISADKIALPDSSEHSWDYLTQAIDALAEDVNHFSDDIAELESKVGDHYSTQEIKIGTWIDGKTLYRRVFSGLTSASQVNVTKSLVSATQLSGIATIITLHGYIRTTSGGNTLFTHDNGNSFILWYNSSSGISQQVSNSSYLNAECVVWFDYTKTTD